MKILHVTHYYYPQPVGGAEAHLEALARDLSRRGHEPVVACPGLEAAEGEHDGVRVRRVPYQHEGPFSSFAALLKEERPDIVHIHIFYAPVAERFVREAKRGGYPVICSYHGPLVNCSRGTLMLWGREPCDGRVDLDRCTRCLLQSLGVPGWARGGLSRVPVRVGKRLEAAGRYGPRGRILQARSTVAKFEKAFHSLTGQADQMVVMSEWTKKLLLLNGVPEEKITLCRYGLVQEGGFPPAARPSGGSAGQPLKVVFLGRFDPDKGTGLLIEALRREPDLPVQLDLYGITMDSAQRRFDEELRRLAKPDPRIRFLPSVPSVQVLKLLRDYDLVVVPSQYLETGPMVVLEAFAAGVPVLGSNLGGIAERVQDGVDGLLVKHDSIEEWRAALRRLCADRALLNRLKSGIRPPRRAAEVADELEELYRHLLHSSGRGGVLGEMGNLPQRDHAWLKVHRSGER